MSEVIRDFIRGHESLPEQEAFSRFLEQDRIRTWVGGDPERREKIRREFARMWAEMHGQPAPAAPAAAPAHAERGATVVQVRRETPAAPRHEVGVGSRKLTLMCPACRDTEIYTRGHLIECRSCGRHYENMLDLVPVQPVGPFTYLFGEGWVGAATAIGMVVLLLVIYGVFRWA